MNKEAVKKNLPVVLCFTFIVILLLLSRFYFEPQWDNDVNAKNALCAKWVGLSMIVLLFMALKDFRVVWLVLLLGSALNALVVVANDGYMPVTSSACIYVEGHHMPFYEGVRLPFLCDWIFGVMSIGDLVLYMAIPVLTISSWRFIKRVST